MRYTWTLVTLMSATVWAADSYLVVQLSNHSAATRIEIAGAKSEASRLLSVVGMKIRWVDCGRNETACPESNDPRTFVVSIEEMIPARLVRSLGYSTPLTERANRAVINYPRIASMPGVSVECLIGTVIVHELAHLLFRSSDHGPGLMKVEWSPEDMVRIGQSRLKFSPEQAARLHDGLRSRAESETILALNRDR